jgi:phenylacetate-coenzyme A ligase PaaK-like adenylate-forming protein
MSRIEKTNVFSKEKRMAKTGKPGTITPAEYDSLKSMVGKFGAKLLVQKVAKICSKRAEHFKHEYPSSSIGAAYGTASSRINSVLGASTAPISTEFFKDLESMVTNYGPEVLVMKLAKTATKLGNTKDGTSLKSIFVASSRSR